ncbi:MAG: TIGR04255 family protein, partial [Planctomycetaceae bacterium]|nr:TIGR04255 family protein [Planctomycetaceae bacterium]
MATRYPNAPITEAIIDLRVTLQEGIDVARLKLQCDDVLASYPKQEELIRAVGQMVVAPHGGTASVQQSPLGWKFTSIDQKQVLQSRENGFAFSRLAPYDSWGPFRDEARRLWELYRG